jgi:transcriptional regulator with XRE-family HTH domain
MEAPHVVRVVRRAGGWSQRDLARRLGVATSTVGAWESGARQPTLASVDAMLSLIGLDLAVCARRGEPPPELAAHLRLSLTSRLRLALGEPGSPYSRATGPAWPGLLALARLGTVVVHPPVAMGIWVPPGRPMRHVSVTVHHPCGELPASAVVDAMPSAGAAPPSLVPVTLSGPRRVWVLPPDELLAEEVGLLRLAAQLLHQGAARDDADRRAPAHRDPDEWDEGSRLLRTK